MKIHLNYNNHCKNLKLINRSFVFLLVLLFVFLNTASAQIFPPGVVGIEDTMNYTDMQAVCSGTVYVLDKDSPGASDVNSGDETHPFLTINKGLSVLRAGDGLLIKKSVSAYVATGNITLSYSGTSSDRIYVRGQYLNDKPLINFNGVNFRCPGTSYWTWESFATINFQFYSSNIHHWQIRAMHSSQGFSDDEYRISGDHNLVEYCDISGAGHNGLYLCNNHNETTHDLNVTGNIFRYNYIHDNTSHHGINIFPQTTDQAPNYIDSTQIYGNVIVNCQWGMYTRLMRYFKIYDNIIAHCTEGGIEFERGYDSNNSGAPDSMRYGTYDAWGLVANNTIYHSRSTYGCGIDDRAANNVTFINNAVWESGETSIDDCQWRFYNPTASQGGSGHNMHPTTVTIDHNMTSTDNASVLWGSSKISLSSWNTNHCTNGILETPEINYNTGTNPRWNIPGDWYPSSSSGNVVNTGADLSNYFTTDYYINTRTGTWDIGAVEFTSAGGGGNNPPNQPSNPNPGNGVVNQAINTTLSWSCSDPNSDPLTYDVYFGTSNNPPFASGNQTSTSYNPGQLNNSTTYYWKIVAKDNQGGVTEGPVWSFSTIAAGGGGDVIPPELIGVQTVESDQVVLDFSEPLDSASVVNPGNYLISDQIQVLNAELSTSQERITLTTDQQVLNHIYTIAVNNLTDTAGNVISSQANSLFYKLLDIGSIGYIEHLINDVNASATTDTNTSPAKTLDGLVNGDPDPNSRWAAQILPQWIQYDLGATEPVGLIAVSFYQWNAGRIYQYSIETSDDLVQWNEVVSNASSSSQEWTLNEFTNLSARYVRIVCLSNNQGDWAGVWEARIFEPNNTTAVEFTEFTAKVNENNTVILDWTTASELNCKQFNITRKKGNGDFVMVGSVPGHGSVTETQQYTFTDNTVNSGHYTYRLEEVDFSGHTSYSNIVEIEVNNPQDYKLEQNFPNPFNPTTTISYSVPKESFVSLQVYDILGNEISTLVNEKKPQGYYNIEFNAKDLPSGIYFSRIQAGSFVAVKKMILLK